MVTELILELISVIVALLFVIGLVILGELQFKQFCQQQHYDNTSLCLSV